MNEGKTPSDPPRPPRVLHSVSIITVMTAISRTGGLVREVAMAYFFGTSALKSAFDIAFIVPNLFRRLFGEGALSSAFVPLFGETLEKEGKERACQFAMRVITLLVIVLGVVTAAGVLLSHPAGHLLPPDSRWVLPLPMMRIMLPYALLICVAALISGMLNTLGRFGVSSFTPFILNLVWILALGVCFFLPNDADLRLKVLCWSILLAGAMQILFQLPALASHGFRFGLIFSGLRDDPKLRRVLVLMAPAALGMGLVQINVCVDKCLAYWADPAAPAALEYAERIVYLPLGMFSTAFMTVLLPTFSRQATRGETGLMRDTLERSMRNLMVIMAPCSAALAFLALPVIELIYGFKGGHFDHTSAVLSARALMVYAPGLLVFSMQQSLTPAFYGLQDLRTPVRVSMFGLIMNVTLNVASVILLPHGWKHAGIAGSTVLTSAVNSFTLATVLHKRIGAPRWSAIRRPLLRSVGASLAMALSAAAVVGVATRAADHAGCHAKVAQLVGMAAAVAVAVAVYGSLMALFGKSELREMVGEFRQRRARKRG